MKCFRFLVLLSFIPTAVAEPTFTKLVSDPVSSVMSTTAAFCDFNRDGWVDLFLGARSASGAAYTNNGDGSFTRLTSGAITTIGGPTYGAAWGDMDNDGWPDLLVGINSGGND